MWKSVKSKPAKRLQYHERHEMEESLLSLGKALLQLDQFSFSFMNHDHLTPDRRLELNGACRALKRSIIFAQTDLWGKLQADDKREVYGGPMTYRYDPELKIDAKALVPKFKTKRRAKKK